MKSLIVTADAKRLLVTLLVACLVLTACSAQPTTEQTDTDATVAETDVAADLSEDPGPSTTTAGIPGSTTSQPATQQSTSTTTTTASTIAPPDLDEELSEFEDLEALLDELDDLLADL